MRFAFIGTRGVPARYGGFETAVEEIGRRLASRGHEVLVFCRSTTGEEHPSEYLGMRLLHLPAVRQRMLETLSHTALSVISPALSGVDSAVVFNAANAPLLPVLRARRIPVATHVDGLEWRRAKWGGAGRNYYRLAEALSVRWSDGLIADAQGIADYYATCFGAATRQIAYGAPILAGAGDDRLDDLGLTPKRFHLVVARFEPENHVLEIVKGYVSSAAQLPLVVVGSAPYSDAYTTAIRAAADDRVLLAGGVWDQRLLDQLYANCLTYLHGHSVGGTNPSLLRAAGAGAPVIAYDVPFNREVVRANAGYFTDPESVAAQVLAAEANPESATRRGALLQEEIARYSWEDVSDSYEDMLTELAKRGQTKRSERPAGRRRADGICHSGATDPHRDAQPGYSEDLRRALRQEAAPGTPRLGVVVVNYGSSDLLAENLPPGLASTSDAQIVVVDNFSTEQERSAVRSLAAARGWELVQSAENVGFGEGVNAGVLRAAEVGCRVFVALNPDAKASPAVLRALAREAGEHQRALISPALARSDGRPFYRGASIDLRTGEIRGGWVGPGDPDARNWLSGACLAFSGETWAELGGFSEGYFLYWEDVDLSLRAAKAGIALVFREDLTVIHDEGGTHRVSGERKSPLYYYYNTRNRLVLASRLIAPADRKAWLLSTPRASFRIWKRGGRRQLLTQPAGAWAAVRGTLAGVRTYWNAARVRPAPHSAEADGVTES